MSVKRYTCNICNKDYKTPQSLWNHKNKIHSNIPKISTFKSAVIPEISSNNTLNIHLVSSNTLKKTDQRICNYCNKELASYKNLHRHLQICKMKDTIIKENEELKQRTAQQEIEMSVMKQSLDELKKLMLEMMNKKCKMHPKTLQKMINSNNNNNNITINNNIQYVELGDEELHKVFSKKEKMKILCGLDSPMNKIIKHAHLNDTYPQFQNIIITNAKGNQAYTYNKTLKKFILTGTFGL